MKAFLFNSIDFSDILIILGLILTGYGLFLLKNPGTILVIIGAMTLNIGILCSVLVITKRRG